jgi:tetratricopeptide (TPR) repeat protein
VTTSGDHEQLPGSAAASTTRPPRRLVTLSPRYLVIVLAVVLALGAGWWFWQREPAVPPPEVPLEDAEPRVAEVIRGEMDTVRRQPRSGPAWGRLGQVLRAHGFDEQAVACWAQAERFDKDEPRWPYYRGLVLLLTGDNSGLSCLRRAAALADSADPDNLAPRLTLAEQLLAHAAAAEAEQVLRAVERKAPNNPRLRFCQAVLAQRCGEVRMAIALFTPLTRHPCARQRASAQLTALYGQRNQPERAAAYRKLAAELPEDARWPDPYWAELANLDVSRQGRFQNLSKNDDAAASEQLREMVGGEDADSDKAHLALAMTLLRQGERDQAEPHLRKALALEPKSVRTLFTLGAVLFFQAQEQQEAGKGARRAAAGYEEAVGLLRRAIELKPNDAEAHLFLGRALLALGRREAAIKALRVPVATRPEYFRGYLHLAEALMEDGQLAEARQHLRRAAQLAPRDDPDLAAVRRRLAGKEKAADPQR